MRVGHGKARPPRTLLATLFAGVLLGALDIAIVGPALPALQAAFSVSGYALSWVFNIYIVVGLVTAPLLAKMSDRAGRRNVYVGCLIVFGVGSAAVAAADGFAHLLVGRAIQAVGAAGLLPVASAVIADAVPVQRRGRALGLIGAVFGVAFVIGPLLGGLLLPYGWSWLFLINLPLVAVVAVISWCVLPPQVARTRLPFDVAGAAVLAVMLAALAWGVGRIAAVESDAWIEAVALLLVAAGLLPAFGWLERRADDPIFHPELLASRQFKVVGAIAVATGLVEAGMVFLPALSVAAFGVSASAASYMMLPLVATLIVGAPSAGSLLDRVGPRPVVQAGLLLTVAGLVVFAVAPLTRANFYIAGACTGLGLSGLLGAPLRFMVLQEAGEDRRGAGQGLLTLFLSSGRIVGAALIGGAAAAGANQLDGHRTALLYLGVIGCLALALSPGLRSRNPARERESRSGT